MKIECRYRIWSMTTRHRGPALHRSWGQVMYRLFIASTILLVFIASARADSVEYPVTPTHLVKNGYVFSVSTNATQGRIAFHVIIAAKKIDVDPNCGAYLAIVTRKQAEGSLTIAPVKPKIQVTLKKEKRIWKADFTVSPKLLKNPNVYFIFSVPAYDTIGGKRIYMPAIDFYEIRLRDFAKR